MLHRSTAMHRNDGRPLSARPWDGTLPLPGEVAALRGDVRQPGLGLDGASLAEIVRGLDLVIHGAAATGFNLSERVYREVNIGGTANVLALIGQRRQAPIPLSSKPSGSPLCPRKQSHRALARCRSAVHDWPGSLIVA